jgi:hypothetical protein
MNRPLDQRLVRAQRELAEARRAAALSGPRTYVPVPRYRSRVESLERLLTRSTA